MEPGMVKDLALGAITPALIALVYFVAAWRKRSAPAEGGSPGRMDWRQIGTPLVMAIGTIATYVVLLGVPSRAPVRALEWVAWIALAAGVAGAVAAMERVPAMMRWLPALAVVVGAWWVSARSPIAHKWDFGQAAGDLVEFMLEGVVVMAAAHRLARGPGVAGLLVLLLFAAGASQLLVFGCFCMSLGQLAGISAAMLGASVCIALWRSRFRLGAGGAVFVSVMTLTMLLQGRLYGSGTPEVERGCAALAILALVGAALVDAGLPSRLGVRRRGALVVGTAAVPLVLGVAFTGKQWAAQGKDEEYSAMEADPSA